MGKESFSKHNIALNCLKQFNEQYNKGRWEAKGTDRSALVMGDALHQVLDVMMRDYVNGALSDVIDALREFELSRAVPRVYPDIVKEHALHYCRMYQSAAKRSKDTFDPAYITRFEWMVRKAMADTRWWVIPGLNEFEEPLTELKVDFTIKNALGEDFEFTSKLDILDHTMSPYDYKTSSELFNPKSDCNILAGKGYQLGTQAVAVYEKFKIVPPKTGFIIFPKKDALEIQVLRVSGLTVSDLANVKLRMCWIVNTLEWHKRQNRFPMQGIEGTKPNCMFCQFKSECGV